jgi:hypothetical protein
MVRRHSFINKIRTLGFTSKTRQKRTDLWRKKGTTDYMSVPTSEMLSDEYVRNALRQAGEPRDSIEAFLASAKS